MNVRQFQSFLTELGLNLTREQIDKEYYEKENKLIKCIPVD
jgi:hypothetical protein